MDMLFEVEHTLSRYFVDVILAFISQKKIKEKLYNKRMQYLKTVRSYLEIRSCKAYLGDVKKGGPNFS